MVITERIVKLNTLYSSTWEALLQKNFIDNIYEATPFTYWLLSKGRMKDQSGGESITERLMYGKNATVAFLGKGDVISADKAEIITKSKWDWKYGAVNLVRYWQDDQQNAGASKVADMVQDDLENAKLALTEKLENALVAGNGTGSAGLEPDGLLNIVSKTPNTGVVGGLDSATQPWWRNRTKLATGIASVTLLEDTANLMNTCSRGGGGDKELGFPDLILTSQKVYEAYQQELIRMYMLPPTTDTIPFPNVRYKTATIMWSPSADVVEDQARVINSKFLRFVSDPTFQFKMTEWKSVPNQVNDTMAQIMIVGNLVCGNRSKQGVLHTIRFS